MTDSLPEPDALLENVEQHFLNPKLHLNSPELGGVAINFDNIQAPTTTIIEKLELIKSKAKAGFTVVHDDNKVDAFVKFPEFYKIKQALEGRS